MSHTLFTKTPLLRTFGRTTPQRTVQSSAYHSTSTPKMPSGTQHLRTLIRQTTLRTSTTALQRSSYPLSQHLHTQRSRTPSPPPPYTTRGTTLRAPQNTWTRFSTPHTLSSIRTFTSTPSIKRPASPVSTSLSPASQQRVDDVIEQIQELYGTAKDEFEIASEESEKNSTYAPDDREAAWEELDKLVEFYTGVVEGEDRGVADEVKRRVGQRVRELVAGVEAMEEAALHGD
jgi:hypothetical protein